MQEKQSLASSVTEQRLHSWNQCCLSVVKMQPQMKALSKYHDVNSPTGHTKITLESIKNMFSSRFE